MAEPSAAQSFSPNQIAALLGVPLDLVYHNLRVGVIPSQKFKGKGINDNYGISPDTVKKLMDKKIVLAARDYKNGSADGMKGEIAELRGEIETLRVKCKYLEDTIGRLMIELGIPEDSWVITGGARPHTNGAKT